MWDANFPKLYYQFTEEVEVELLPIDYLIFDSEFQICWGIAELDFDLFLFGDTFLKGQYIIHDMDN